MDVKVRATQPVTIYGSRYPTGAVIRVNSRGEAEYLRHLGMVEIVGEEDVQPEQLELKAPELDKRVDPLTKERGQRGLPKGSRNRR